MKKKKNSMISPNFIIYINEFLLNHPLSILIDKPYHRDSVQLLIPYTISFWFRTLLIRNTNTEPTFLILIFCTEFVHSQTLFGVWGGRFRILYICVFILILCTKQKKKNSNN